MCDTQDGFRSPRWTSRSAGPASSSGRASPGFPEFRAANLLTDGRLLEEARQEALTLVERDPGLRAAEHHALREALVARWREKLDLASVG